MQKLKSKLMKEKLHSSHIGAEGCVRRARECMFWPNMADDIRTFVNNCTVCKQYDAKTQVRLWFAMKSQTDRGQKLEVTYSTYEEKTIWYVLITWATFGRLISWKLQIVKQWSENWKCISLVMDYLITWCLIMDHCRDHKHLSILQMSLSNAITPSSPGNSKGNGKAESGVKTAKSLMKKPSKHACIVPAPASSRFVPYIPYTVCPYRPSTVPVPSC